MPWWIYPLLLLGDFSLWLVHEAGHIIAWKAMGVNPKGIKREGWKLGVEYKADVSELKASHKLLGAVSGPLASILVGIALWQIEPLIGACSIMFGLLCCFPVRDSDGWKIGKYTYQLINKEHNV